MRTVLFILSVVFVLAMCNIARADVVTLVDGDSYKGVVIEETEDFIVLETEDGIMEINREDIDSIKTQAIEQEGVEEETFPSPDREEKDESGVEEEGIGAQEPAEEVVGEVEEVAEEEPIEEEEEGGPITIKPKITGSGTYKTY